MPKNRARTALIGRPYRRFSHRWGWDPQLIRWTGAATPREYTERMEVWEDEIRDRAFEQGYQSAQDDALERRTFGPLGRPLDPTGCNPLR